MAHPLLTPEAAGSKTPTVTYSEVSRQAFLRDTQALIDRLASRVQKDRDAFDDYLMLGRLYRIRSDARRALRLHRNLLVKADLSRDQQIRLHVELGFDLLELRVQDFGIGYFEKALDLQRGNVPALEGIVRAFEFQSEYERAAEALGRLIRMGRPEQKHLSFVYAALALKHLDRGLIAKARRSVQRALKADPESLYAHLGLADVYIEGEKYEKAIVELRSILLRWPSHSFLVLRRMEDTHYRMNAFPKYEDTLRDCIRSAPDNYYVHYSLARHLKKKKRNSDALAALRASLEVQPLYVNSIRDRVEWTGEGQDLSEIRKLAKGFFASLKSSRRFICPNCRHRFTQVAWYCTVCGLWNTFEIRYELPAP